MHPNYEAMRQALGIMLVATPFMFGVLILFSVVIMLLAKIQPKPSKDSE